MKYRKEDITLKNIIAFIEGNLRYRIYYSTNPFIRSLMRKHIREQIEARIRSMNMECYNKGYCIVCGCKTTALQMAHKACDGDCYPPMVGRKTWKFIKSADYRNFYFDKNKNVFMKIDRKSSCK